jgi:hypothetical protein
MRSWQCTMDVGRSTSIYIPPARGAWCRVHCMYSRGAHANHSRCSKEWTNCLLDDSRSKIYFFICVTPTLSGSAMCGMSPNKIIDAALQPWIRVVVLLAVYCKCVGNPLPHGALTRSDSLLLGVSMAANSKHTHRHDKGYAKIATHASTGIATTAITAPF